MTLFSGWSRWLRWRQLQPTELLLRKEGCKYHVRKTSNLCKSMMGKGLWPPLVVVFYPQDGFIRDLTIVTEYAGAVDYLENREDYDGDSMMMLIYASNPSRSLVICPDKRANIARFINVINNHKSRGRKEEAGTFKCVRFDVDGECLVLLITNKDITKGEVATLLRLQRERGRIPD